MPHFPSDLDRAPHSGAPLSRRAFLQVASLAAGAAVVVSPRRGDAQPRPVQSMVIYKDPGCGCCNAWVDHVKAAGFAVTERDTTDMASVKASFGVPDALGSCHTARVGNYVIEGHVPADLITKLLREQPAAARGLAVPGMPIGSPGMEQGNRKDRYDVLLFDKAGKTRVYATR
jgi:hypothetical protein